MSLHKKSLKFRKRNLRACIQPVPGRLEFVVEFEGKTAKDVRQRMDEVMEARGEGLILKHPESEYTLNGRNKDWIKVKPEYMVYLSLEFLRLAHSSSHRTTWERLLMYLSSVSDTRSEKLKPAKEFAAGNYGTRKRSGGVSTLICAVLDDRHADNEDEPRKEV